MLKIITSDTSNTAMDAVIDKIREPIGETLRDVVIVPDAYTLTAEKYVLEHLGLKGSMRIEVVSFSRLAYKELGAHTGKVLSKEGAVLILKKVIALHIDELTHYRKVAETPGFAGEIYAVIASIRNNGVTPDDLEEAINALDGGTKTKNEDILLLYREYLKAISAYSDSTTRLEAFIELIPSSDALRKSRYFIFGFDSLSKKQCDIILALSAVADVVIGLTNTNNGKNAELYPSDLVSRLTGASNEAGIECDASERRREAIREPFTSLNAEMFSLVGGRKTPDGTRNVCLFAERSIYAEYNAVAHEISRLVRREGYRYKDIAIVDCNSAHATERAEIFDRYRIPYFADKRYPLSGTLPAKYILSAVNVVRYGYRKDKVFALIKNPLFGFDKNAIDAFENFVLKENINFNDFSEPFSGEYIVYEHVRSKLMEVTDGFRYAKTVSDFSAHAKRLIDGDTPELLKSAVEGAEENIVKSNLKALERLSAVLDEYIALIGDEAETPQCFSRTLEASCVAEEIALIPRFKDSVYIGKLREGFIVRPKALFVLNATSDLLPSTPAYKAILSAPDIDKMQEAGIRLYPTPADRMREELFCVIDLVTKAQKLYFGYPESEPSGAENRPSQAITEVKRITGVKIKSLEDEFSLDKVDCKEALEDVIVTPENAFFTYLAYRGDKSNGWYTKLYESLSPEEKAIADGYKARGEVLSVPLKSSLKRGNGYVTKVSQLESYFRCPYGHYLQYGLRLKERDDGTVKPARVGDLIHECLEKYFRATLGRLRRMSEDERMSCARTAVTEVFDFNPEALRIKKSATGAHTVSKLKAESLRVIEKLTENLLKGEFEPMGVELEFGRSINAIPPLEIETEFGKVALRGKIDRVDRYKDKVAVIDYKTGKEEGHISELYYGKKLQLYIYLKTVSEHFGLEPAGALYVPVRTGYNTDENLKLIGQVTLDEDIVNAFENGFVEKARSSSNGAESEVLALKLKYKGDKVAVTPSIGAVDSQKMQNALEYATLVASGALNEIADGNIARSPLGGMCEHCSFLEVCGGAKDEDVRLLSRSARPYLDGEEGEGDNG